MNVLRISAVVILLVCLAVPANAGSVTYDFIETGGGNLTGGVGAIFVFNSPPASSTEQWQTYNNGDVLSLQVLDTVVNPSGGSAALLDINVVSYTGASLDSGTFDALNSYGAEINGFFNGSESVMAAGPPVFGGWVVASVPEPSTLVLSGIATIAGLGLWARRRQRV